MNLPGGVLQNPQNPPQLRLWTIPESEISSQIQGLDLYSDKLPTDRTLGIEWCIEDDAIKFTINLEDRPTTKRGILSTVSQIYDPLGLLAPFLLQGRSLMQRACQEDGGWDDDVSMQLQENGKGGRKT